MPRDLESLWKGFQRLGWSFHNGSHWSRGVVHCSIAYTTLRQIRSLPLYQGFVHCSIAYSSPRQLRSLPVLPINFLMFLRPDLSLFSLELLDAFYPLQRVLARGRFCCCCCRCQICHRSEDTNSLADHARARTQTHARWFYLRGEKARSQYLRGHFAWSSSAVTALPFSLREKDWPLAS